MRALLLAKPVVKVTLEELWLQTIELTLILAAEVALDKLEEMLLELEDLLVKEGMEFNH